MEELGDLISKGFSIWRENLNLCIPFLFSLAFSLFALIPFSAAFAAILLPLANLNSTSLEVLIPIIENSLPNLALTFIFSALLLTIVGSFFTAGAIGMAQQALKIGRTTLNDMWSSGKKNLANMVLVSILTAIILIAGIIFLLPGIIFLFPETHEPTPQTIGIIIIGLILFILYALLMSLILALAPYALVIEELGPIKAIKVSMRFFRNNKFDVFIIWLIIVAISIGLQMIGGSISMRGEATFAPMSIFTGIINLLVLAPLSTVWWARLYMSRTGKLEEMVNPW